MICLFTFLVFSTIVFSDSKWSRVLLPQIHKPDEKKLVRNRNAPHRTVSFAFFFDFGVISRWMNFELCLCFFFTVVEPEAPPGYDELFGGNASLHQHAASQASEPLIPAPILNPFLSNAAVLFPDDYLTWDHSRSFPQADQSGRAQPSSSPFVPVPHQGSDHEELRMWFATVDEDKWDFNLLTEDRLNKLSISQ